MTQEQEDFRQEMLMDAAEEAHRNMEDAKKDYRLSTDYEFLMETYADEFEAAIDALKALKLIHEKHEQDWNIKDIEDELS